MWRSLCPSLQRGRAPARRPDGPSAPFPWCSGSPPSWPRQHAFPRAFSVPGPVQTRAGGSARQETRPGGQAGPSLRRQPRRAGSALSSLHSRHLKRTQHIIGAQQVCVHSAHGLAGGPVPPAPSPVPEAGAASPGTGCSGAPVPCLCLGLSFFFFNRGVVHIT